MLSLHLHMVRRLIDFFDLQVKTTASSEMVPELLIHRMLCSDPTVPDEGNDSFIKVVITGYETAH